jgi:hypothetical protein
LDVLPQTFVNSIVVLAQIPDGIVATTEVGE